MRRLKFCSVVMLGLVMTAVAAHAGKRAPDDGPQWPNVSFDDGPQWPNVRLADTPPNPKPAFVDTQETEHRAAERKRSAAWPANGTAKPSRESNPPSAGNGYDANASANTNVAARWPTLQPARFTFEVGARYWYSTGNMRFGFTNGNPAFGKPTSTLDWYGLTAHTGEVFGRVDHIPSGVFVKGMVGGGSVADGHIDDRDFFATQLKFSDTSSDVTGGNPSFAMFDIGWAYSPTADMRLGFFVGYHYWREKVAANGLVCNLVSPQFGCPAVNAVPIGFGTAVFNYEPTWHAVRIGAESKYMIDSRWSVSGEIAVIPYAVVENKDSHLLRQDALDLGPAPNVISRSKYAYGVEAELFVNYAVTPNIEVGGGLRYWGLGSHSGGVEFGPSFATTDALLKFDQERYGVLVHAKGRF